MDLTSLVEEVATGVANLVLESRGTRAGSGTGFLIPGYLVTASHVLQQPGFDVLRVAFDQQEGDPIRLARADVSRSIAYESPANELDLALIRFDEPEIQGRYRFEVRGRPRITPGTRVLFLGYPFESGSLAAHVGYVSSCLSSGPADVLHIDGSVNPSNSGGPVLEIEAGRLVGYVTRAQQGLLRDFDQLVSALDHNIQLLSRPQAGRLVIGGIDPNAAFLTTMQALRVLAVNMRRSANVGIGYAFSARHIVEAVEWPGR